MLGVWGLPSDCLFDTLSSLCLLTYSALCARVGPHMHRWLLIHLFLYIHIFAKQSVYTQKNN